MGDDDDREELSAMTGAKLPEKSIRNCRQNQYKIACSWYVHGMFRSIRCLALSPLCCCPRALDSLLLPSRSPPLCCCPHALRLSAAALTLSASLLLPSRSPPLYCCPHALRLSTVALTLSASLLLPSRSPPLCCCPPALRLSAAALTLSASMLLRCCRALLTPASRAYVRAELKREEILAARREKREARKQRRCMDSIHLVWTAHALHAQHTPCMDSIHLACTALYYTHTHHYSCYTVSSPASFKPLSRRQPRTRKRGAR
jgi:hypothetical protein